MSCSTLSGARKSNPWSAGESHTLSHAQGLLQGCLPYAAWRACHPAQAPGKRAGAALALGWGQHVLLLDVPLARSNADAAAGTLCEASCNSEFDGQIISLLDCFDNKHTSA